MEQQKSCHRKNYLKTDKCAKYKKKKLKTMLGLGGIEGNYLIMLALIFGT